MKGISIEGNKRDTVKTMSSGQSPLYNAHARHCKQLQTKEQANDRHGAGTENLATDIGIRTDMRVFKDYPGKNLGTVVAVSGVPYGPYMWTYV